MRWAARPRGFIGLMVVSIATAALLHTSALAHIPAPAHIGRLWIVLGWLQARLALPVEILDAALIAYLFVSRRVARRRLERATWPAPPPAVYAHFSLPARAAVALAAAARARR